MLIDIRCTGISPLILNRMTEDALLGLRKTGPKKAKTAPRPELPRDEAEPKLYKAADGTLYLPTENVFSCFVSAGQAVRLDGKRQISTAKSTTLPAFLTILDPHLPLIDPDTEKSPAWEVDLRQGKNPNGGEAVCIIRPRFDRWAFDLHVDFNSDELSELIFRELVDKAGARIGLGDFRPARRGPFGRFTVTRWEAKRERKAA